MTVDSDSTCHAGFDTEPVLTDPPGSPLIGRLRRLTSIDPARPTIVLTHGLQSISTLDTPNDVWTGFSSDPKKTGAGYLLYEFYGGGANILQYTWDDAYQVSGAPNGDEYYEAWKGIKNAGINLARLLLTSLADGGSYTQPVHFIGHSMGTAVNAYAANTFFSSSKTNGINSAQFTILDHPQRIAKIVGCGLSCERLLGFNESFFTALLQSAQDDHNLRIDNYYADPEAGFFQSAGVGAPITGQAYNHPALYKPNDVGGRFFDHEDTSGFIDNDHSGVHQWYRWTMTPTDPLTSDPEMIAENLVCDAGTFDEWKPFRFSATLDPCDRGWFWSVFGSGANQFPGDVGNRVDLESKELAFGTEIELTCVLDTTFINELICTETSPPTRADAATASASTSPSATFNVNIPPGTGFIAFDYTFTSSGEGDYASVLIDDIPIWTLLGSSVIAEGEYVDSGPIPIEGLSGNRLLTVRLYGVGLPNAELRIRNFRTFRLDDTIFADGFE